MQLIKNLLWCFGLLIISVLILAAGYWFIYSLDHLLNY